MAAGYATEKMRAMAQSKSLPWRPVVMRDPCVYCVVWPMASREGDKHSVEHIRPLSEGGVNTWHNLVGAHAACNTARSSTPLLRFFLYRHKVRGIRNRHKRAALRRRLLRPLLAVEGV